MKTDIIDFPRELTLEQIVKTNGRDLRAIFVQQPLSPNARDHAREIAKAVIPNSKSEFLVFDQHEHIDKGMSVWVSEIGVQSKYIDDPDMIRSFGFAPPDRHAKVYVWRDVHLWPDAVISGPLLPAIAVADPTISKFIFVAPSVEDVSPVLLDVCQRLSL